MRRREALVATFVALSLTTGAAPTSQPAVEPAAAAPSNVAYAADFDTDAPGPQWWTDATSITPDGSRKFLGPFNEGAEFITLAHLPPHAAVRVRFDLITFERWNGDSSIFGRDAWDMRVANGQPLIHTTFSDCGFFVNNNEQSYPDQYPWYPTHEGFTGAAAKQSLGWRTSQGPDSWGDDSTYAIDVTFPHAGDTLRLAFASQIKRHENKPYGFLNFRVETVEHLYTATDADLAHWWDDLAGDDPVRADHAVWSLVARGDVATAFVQRRLPTAADAAPAPVNVDLGAIWSHGSFQYDTPASRQTARAMHVLEAIGTPTAIQLMHQAGYKGTPVAAPPDGYTRPDERPANLPPPP